MSRDAGGGSKAGDFSFRVLGAAAVLALKQRPFGLGLAAIDGDGFLLVQGRADGAINCGGFKVLPESVIAALAAHPAAADAAVITRGDPSLGEVPVTAVELKPREAVTGEELREWPTERLLAYQVPIELHILERLPRTGSLKIALGEVAALFR